MLVIVDIDATIADATKRLKVAGPEPDRNDKAAYLAWLDRVQNAKSLAADQPVPGMEELCAALSNFYKCQLYYVTSREEKWRSVTWDWLRLYGFLGHSMELLMRPNADWRSSGEFKEEVIKSLLTESKESVIVIDDDEKGDLEVVCKRNGWTFLKARSGGQK